MKIKYLVSLIAALFATGLSDLSISYAAEPEVSTVKDFKWGDQTNLKQHLLKHVTFPATGKVIKETCKNEFPDEFSQEQRAYLGVARWRSKITAALFSAFHRERPGVQPQ